LTGAGEGEIIIALINRLEAAGQSMIVVVGNFIHAKASS